MPKAVVWSLLADQDFNDILNYLASKWEPAVAEHFMELTFKLIQQISDRPKQFPLIYKRGKVRKCVISKHNSIIYREQNEEIEILRVFDTRQHPKKLRFK